MTAAVKPAALLERCIASGTTVVVDNADELDGCSRACAERAGTTALVALRLAPDLGAGRPQTRFGFGGRGRRSRSSTRPDPRRRASTASTSISTATTPADRVTAIGQALALVDALRERGHAPTFIDIGGGIPMSYLDAASQWERFWGAHRDGLLGRARAADVRGSRPRSAGPRR